ncbi:MAG: hypothetical protein Q8941_11390 [Bacteroidota bacterium]|nr:hypothetical protein [Bacteroidota bacterium]
MRNGLLRRVRPQNSFILQLPPGETSSGKRLKFGDSWERDNGQIKATGTYKTIITKAHTGIDNQFHKSSLTTTDWKFFNPDGSKSNDKDKIIADIEYNLNCD